MHSRPTERNHAGHVAIRCLSTLDDLDVLTELIHDAYARHAANNLKFWATHQTSADTARRFESGHGLIAEMDSKIVGTLLLRAPSPDAEVPLYRDPFTWTLNQFAVLPRFQGIGIGRKLHNAALAHIRSNGGLTIALDTAAPATDLIAMYQHWGYSIAGECDWRPKTNYPSVVMSRPINISAGESHA